MKAYFETYQLFFKENLPQLFAHFSALQVTPDIYIIDWWVCLLVASTCISLKPGFQLNATHARNRLRCVHCVNENRKQRKHLIGCFDDWLVRSTIPIGWRLRALRLDGNRVLRNVFDCVIFLLLLRFLRTFLTQSVAFSWKPGFSHCETVLYTYVTI